MPNRVIKESIKYSEQIDSLTWFEEVVFYRLMVTADDYGCLDGRTILLKNELFPTRDDVTKKAIGDAIRKLTSVGLLCEYTVSGKPYLFFPTWEKHQRVRNKQRKFPAPPNDVDLTANRCQTSADCCQTSASCLPESNPIQSESNPNPNPNIQCHADHADKPSPVSEIIAYLNEKAGTSYKTTSKETRSKINARLKEGFTVDDFKNVIDKKCTEWLNDQKMSQYLRPSTLFGTKFEGYLNAPERSKDGRLTGNRKKDPTWGTVL